MQRIHVAVGVIINAKQQILIAKRPAHLHQGGKWEFPGGKVEQNESVTEALARELKEEVNIEVTASTPFLTINFDYSDKQVFLDIHQVTAFDGIAQGQEGQQIRWVNKSELSLYQFPKANEPIIEKLLT